MGDIIGGIIGGVGQAAAASAQADAAKHAADLSMTGYNYLTKGAGAAPETAYINAGQTALKGQGTTQNAIAQLLGVAPSQALWNNAPAGSVTPTASTNPVHISTAPGAGAANAAAANGSVAGQPQSGPQQVNIVRGPGGGSSGGDYLMQTNGGYAGAPKGLTSPTQYGNGTPGSTPLPGGTTGQATAGNTAPDAFQGYQNSTGYQFQLGQGLNAINSNAAAKGLMGSGGTAKALEQYGQNLASTTFNNYLTQLSGLNSMQGGTAQMGQNSLGQIGTVGTAAGGGAANAVIQGGNAQAAGITGIANTIGNAAGAAFNSIGGWSPSSNQFPGGGSVNSLGGLY